MYSDRLNYYDLAATIRDMFIKAIENHDNVGGPIMDEDIDLDEFSKYLEKGFLIEALDEFTNTSFGKGLLMGAYLEHALEKAKREEREALKEMGEEIDEDEEAEA